MNKENKSLRVFNSVLELIPNVWPTPLVRLT